MIRQIFPITALFLSTAFLLAGGGMQAILLPVRGQLEGFSPSLIGLIGAGWAVGFTLGCIIVPRMVRRVGHVRTFGALAALLATSVLLNGLVIEAYSWIVLRALAGFCFSGSYMIIESWLNERISDENRGAMFSVYMIISQGAYMLGQYFLVLAEPEKETLFMIAAILYALAILPTALSKAQSPAPLTEVKLNFPRLFKNSPASVIGAFTAGMIAGAFGSFAPVFWCRKRHVYYQYCQYDGPGNAGSHDLPVSAWKTVRQNGSPLCHDRLEYCRRIGRVFNWRLSG